MPMVCRRPRRFELVVLRSPEAPGQWCLKRVVGLPGERVEIRGGDLWIDGRVLRKSLAEMRETAVLVDAAPAPIKFSHVFLSELQTDANRQARLDRHLALGLNKMNVYLANKGDYGGTWPTTPWLGTASANDKTRFDLARWRAYDRWVLALRDAGCRVMQIEEPTFHFMANSFGKDHSEVKFMIDAFNREVEGLDDVELWIHTCWGNPNMQRVMEDTSYANSIEIYLEQCRGDVWTLEMKDRHQKDIELFAPFKNDLKKKIAIGAVSHRVLQADRPEEVRFAPRDVDHVERREDGETVLVLRRGTAVLVTDDLIAAAPDALRERIAYEGPPPTESAAVAVVYGVTVSLVLYRDITVRDLPRLLVNAFQTSATVMLVIGATGALAWLITAEQVAVQLAGWIKVVASEPWMFLLLVNVVLLLLGIGLPAWLGYLLVAAFVSSFVYLVLTMKPGGRDPWDDGAQV